MKTGKEWLATLPEWIQDTWKANFNAEQDEWLMSFNCRSLSEFICMSFDWSESHQGTHFWSEVAGYGTTMSKDYFKSIKNNYVK